MVAAASDLGACVCEDDATVSELDDLRARVAELEAERDQALALLDEICQDSLEVPLSHVDALSESDLREYDQSAKFKRLRDLIANSSSQRVRVQAEQIAALQEAAKRLIRRVVIVTRPVADYGPANDERCQVDARDLYYLMQTADLLREALALAEGCAAPADEEEK